MNTLYFKTSIIFCVSTVWSSITSLAFMSKHTFNFTLVAHSSECKAQYSQLKHV